MQDGAAYLMQVRPYRGLNNVIDGAVVTFVDISERREIEQARSTLAAIVGSSRDAILGHDLDGMITSWTTGAEALYGYTAAEAIGRSMTDLLDGSLPDDWPQRMARLHDGETITGFDSTKVSKTGRRIEVSLSISPVREGEGRIVGASVLARDTGDGGATGAGTAAPAADLDGRTAAALRAVIAGVEQALRSHPETEAFATELADRIRAIGAEQGLQV